MNKKTSVAAFALLLLVPGVMVQGQTLPAERPQIPRSASISATIPADEAFVGAPVESAGTEQISDLEASIVPAGAASTPEPQQRAAVDPMLQMAVFAFAFVVMILALSGKSGKKQNAGGTNQGDKITFRTVPDQNQNQ
jgi:hypothetical protein